MKKGEIKKIVKERIKIHEDFCGRIKQKGLLIMCIVDGIFNHFPSEIKSKQKCLK